MCFVQISAAYKHSAQENRISGEKFWLLAFINRWMPAAIRHENTGFSFFLSMYRGVHFGDAPSPFSSMWTERLTPFVNIASMWTARAVDVNGSVDLDVNSSDGRGGLIAGISVLLSISFDFPGSRHCYCNDRIWYVTVITSFYRILQWYWPGPYALHNIGLFTACFYLDTHYFTFVC